ncbi:MAG: hypothetical protein H6918_05585 [Sphingomonadaceae bacterium]|nr:hypothetical protein [Sphingomonadaceae bacterium]
MPLLAGCGGTGGGLPANATVEERVLYTANSIAPALPRPAGDGTLVQVTPEGKEMVLHIEIAFGGRVRTNPTEMTKTFRPTICKDEVYRDLIKHGGAIGLDIVDPKTQQRLPKASIAYCA